MPREHKIIYDAIVTGDTEKARKAADVHIDRLKKLVEEENI
jgi:DNA-binding FadR family transcriptional regulator